jgi:hypothetical protein
MRRDLRFDHFALALAYRRHVDRNTAGYRAEVASVLRQMCDLRTENLILGWQAGNVGAGTPDPPPLHGGSPPS